MGNLVKCFYCGQMFDREKESYTQPQSRRYAHKKCSDYADKIHQITQSKLKEYYIKPKVNKDIKSLCEQYSIEDIYGMVEYWFCKKKHLKPIDPSLSGGGLGIIQYISPEYFSLKKKKEKNMKINLGKNIEDYVDAEGSKVMFVLPPIRKPRGKNFFNLV